MKPQTLGSNVMTTTIHIALAFILFFIQNWIGSRAYSKGYIRFSLLDDKDEALSLNYVIKVFGPIVYLILTVALFQYFKIDNFKTDIINVIYYYLGIRLTMIFIYERAKIVNWARILFYYLSIIIISTIIYNNFIDSVDSLLPDFTQIKNEIWLLIIIFIYELGNGFEGKTPKNEIFEATNAYLPEIKSRKKKYILQNFKRLNNEYGKIIDEISSSDSSFRLVIISILIFENFNRPRIIRFLERIWVRFSKAKVTQGIMQIASDKPLSDLDSVRLGTKYLFSKYSEFLKEEAKYYLFRRTIKQHCPDRKYIRQVLFIIKCIIDNSGKKDDYSKIFKEIKSEFELYDYYD